MIEGGAPVADIRKTHDFAVKWLDKFRGRNINYIELVDHFMADDCATLGFNMDKCYVKDIDDI